MVAVTVILAAVIGTFVLGIGSQVTNDVPRVSAELVFDEGSTAGFQSGSSDEEVTITHRGGDPVDGDELKVNVGGTTVDPTCFDSGSGFPSEFDAGTSVAVTETGGSCSLDIESGDKVRLIWTDSEGEGSAILGEERVP